MRLVIDASSLIGSSMVLNSSEIRSIFAAAQDAGIIITIPEVVVDEVNNHYREKLSSLRQKAIDASARYYSLARTVTATAFADEEFDQSVCEHRSMLLKLVSGSGGSILAYPEVPHKELATLDIAKVKPFGGKKVRTEMLLYGAT